MTIQTTTLTEQAAIAVENGISLLNEAEPGWREWILEPIQMKSETSCVLGQIFGTYLDGVNALFDVSVGSPEALALADLYGFDYDAEATIGGDFDTYFEALNEAWRVRVKTQ